MQHRSEETITQIMAAAIHLFSNSGYEAASVADICARAEISKGAFYHHFPSKQTLFLAIVEQWCRQFIDQAAEPPVVRPGRS